MDLGPADKAELTPGSRRTTIALRLCLAILTICAGHYTAQAREAKNRQVAAAAKWGLLGEWKADCDKPASDSNWKMIYVVRSDRLILERKTTKQIDWSRVTKVTTRDDGTIELTVDFRSLNQVRQYAMARGKDGRIRAVFNRNVKTNEYIIKDGKFVSGHEQTAWQTRCR